MGLIKAFILFYSILSSRAIKTQSRDAAVCQGGVGEGRGLTPPMTAEESGLRPSAVNLNTGG